MAVVVRNTASSSRTYREIGKDAVWSVSTAKAGNGVDQIRDDNLDTYWQSDGSHPHTINVQFHRKVTVEEVAFYLDYNLDESYTPKKLSIRAGSMSHDLVEISVVELTEPVSWVAIPLFATDERTGDQKALRCHFLQVCILAMHQNGRDTHIRACKVFGPRQPIDDFSTVGFSQFSTVR